MADILRDNSFRKSIPGAEVQAKDVRKLRPGTWLNDEILNFYAVMLNKCAGLPNPLRSSSQPVQGVRRRVREGVEVGAGGPRAAARASACSRLLVVLLQYPQDPGVRQGVPLDQEGACRLGGRL